MRSDIRRFAKIAFGFESMRRGNARIGPRQRRDEHRRPPPTRLRKAANSPEVPSAIPIPDSAGSTLGRIWYFGMLRDEEATAIQANLFKKGGGTSSRVGASQPAALSGRRDALEARGRTNG